MTQTAVARKARLSRSFYAQVEHADQAISVDRAFAIASVLGVERSPEGSSRGPRGSRREVGYTFGA